MKYKVLATDMDGTLLKNNKRISNRDIVSLRKAKERGMEIIICTGRPLGTLKPYLSQIGFPCWVVTNNGAVIRNKSNEVVEVINLKKEPCKEVLQILDQAGIYYHATDPHYAFIKSYWERIEIFQRFVRKKEGSFIKSWAETLYQILFSGTHRKVNMYKYLEKGGALSSIFVYTKDLKKLESVTKKLQQIKDIHITSSERHNIEILDTYATKGVALKKIVDEMGIKQEEVVAVGDNHNDLSMIQYAGLGIAMGNGEEEVLKTANWVTKSNEDDGISYLLESLYNGKIQGGTSLNNE
ncbi:Cof-type HAD-IIB family hydrolase [Alkaliphilus transvaalensis]|uniref:Cof-type HAD-IIB family hydrolase n=1 Tax=Alkaliphilus transvaalensis TaxID=114628 RepID=UPI00047CA2AE|nr:Cof-type HAD-IIB family hydrolase [Alkaliphilus transvaalensis]